MYIDQNLIKMLAKRYYKIKFLKGEKDVSIYFWRYNNK